tara:strand:+ start:372 stop:1745 length:1374 start_codon:yes stop_codon:yes gene_type:complete
MFQNLSLKITQAFRTLSGTTHITESMLKDSAKIIKRALQEADVANSVIQKLLSVFHEKTLGQAIRPDLKPADMLMKQFHDEILHVLGSEQDSRLQLNKQPSIIMLVGLQGAGKTTFAARLGHHLQQQAQKKVMLVSCDVYRPAAIKQLAVLAEQTDCVCFPSDAKDSPIDIVNQAKKAMQEHGCDTLIVDTAGRLHVDEDMMQESHALKETLQPSELLFVLDSMTGQDAALTAQAFHQRLALTGCVLTKTDGDSRGGAALSIKHITGKPIKFITNGEKIDNIDTFEPSRITQQIIGMGDIVGLLKKFEQHVDSKKAKSLIQKITKTGQFDFADLRDQLKQMESMGGMESIMKNLPGMSAIPQDMLQGKLGMDATKPILAMIDSMTQQERYFPQLVINIASRKKRILKGSGRTPLEFNNMIKQFKKMQKMMKRLKGNRMQSMMAKMAGMMSGNGQQDM